MSPAVRAVIAYLMGSFWICVECAEAHYQEERSLEASVAKGWLCPAYEGETFGVYQYNCDHPGCGKVIQAKITSQGDGLG